MIEQKTETSKEVQRAQNSVETLKSLIEKSHELAEKTSNPAKTEAEEIRHWVVEMIRQMPEGIVFSRWTVVDEWRRPELIADKNQRYLTFLS